jgi:hypothetical protein
MPNLKPTNNKLARADPVRPAQWARPACPAALAMMVLQARLVAKGHRLYKTVLRHYNVTLAARAVDPDPPVPLARPVHLALPERLDRLRWKLLYLAHPALLDLWDRLVSLVHLVKVARPDHLVK